MSGQSIDVAAVELLAPAEPFYFCGARPQELARAARGVMRWNRQRSLEWCIADRLPGMEFEQQIEQTKWAFQQWQEATNGYFTFTQVTSTAKADIVITSRRIDRAGGVLAEMQLPPGDDRQLTGWFDLSEQWNRSIQYPLVCLHELGHAMGMDHISGALAVLNPIYNPQLGKLQPADVATLLRIYPEAATFTPPKPPADPPPPVEPTPPTDPINPPSLPAMFPISVVMPWGTYTGNVKRTI